MRSPRIAFAATLVVAAATAFASLASAYSKPSFTMVTPTIAKITGYYNFACTAPTNFPGTPSWLRQSPTNPNVYGPTIIASPAPCADGSYVYMYASFPAAGAPWIIASAFGNATVGTIAAHSDSISDSLAVSVDRSTPGQVKLSIFGGAKHYNPDQALNGGVSKLKIAVYPDSTNANNETGLIQSGEVRLYGLNKLDFLPGFLGASDFTTTSLGANAVRVGAIPGLQKTIAVPNANTAVVRVEVDPSVLDAALPASNPPTLALMAIMMLGAAGWFLWRRNARMA